MEGVVAPTRIRDEIIAPEQRKGTVVSAILISPVLAHSNQKETRFEVLYIDLYVGYVITLRAKFCASHPLTSWLICVHFCFLIKLFFEKRDSTSIFYLVCDPTNMHRAITRRYSSHFDQVITTELECNLEWGRPGPRHSRHRPRWHSRSSFEDHSESYARQSKSRRKRRWKTWANCSPLLEPDSTLYYQSSTKVLHLGW